MRTTLPRLAAIAAALVAAAPVLAQAEVPSMTVSSAGLDLSDPKGRTAFERRITHATKRVCGVRNDRELATITRERRCMADSRERSGKEVAALFARHKGVRLAQAGTVDAGAGR